MTSNKKVIISLSIIGLLLVSLAISYAYFSAKITNNESESTVVATAAYLELTFIDGSPEINASNILPGWSASKTFSVQNTGENTAYYVLKITDINNPFVYGGISYKIESSDGGANVDLDTLPLADMPVSGPIEIPVNTTHNYTITTYYNELEESQMQDLGKSFSYTVSIEAVYKKEIQYIEDLVDLSNEVNNGDKYEHTWFVLTRDLDFNSDESYKNANNTTTYGDYNGNGTVESIKTELTTGRGFIPIGTTTSNIFYGSFDGYNHRLDNIYIKNNQSSIAQLGLFGVVTNMTISNFSISGEIQSETVANIGGIIGASYISSGTVINNCHNDVNIESKSNKQYVGGLTGGGSSNSKIVIRKSSNNGIIKGSNATGGLIGYNNGILIIENSYNTGNIENSIGPYAGGILGRSNATTNITNIYNSYNSGTIKTSFASTSAIGGIIGCAIGNGSIKNNYNEGEIISSVNTTDDYDFAMGGIIGQIYEGTYEIGNCYNTANVTGNNRVGGIIGSISHVTLKASNNYNTGSIKSTMKNSSYETSVGGFMGYQFDTTNSYILNFYNTGTISSKLHAGGVIGKHRYGTATILNSYNIGNTTGNTHAGGLIGFMNKSSTKLYVNNFYSVGVSNNYNLFYKSDNGTSSLTNSYCLNTKAPSNISNVGTSLSSEYIASPEFVNLLNQNKRNINLSSIDASLASYELSDWKYDAEKGYPVLDN